MSTAYAIAAVTALLKDVIDDGLLNSSIMGGLGGDSFRVTALPPNRIQADGTERNQLNLFLYQTLPNSGWRNAGLPARDRQGARVGSPPLALDLFYLLTAYSAGELSAEMLLGHAMLWLHETPVFDRAEIRRLFGRAGAGQARVVKDSAIADQVELLKISPQSMSLDEMSKLWSALQAPYRPTAAYHVSVVLMQSERPARRALPVLQIGKDDRGPVVQAHLVPPYPTIERLELPRGQLGLRAGDRLIIAGHDLAGDDGDPAGVEGVVQLATARLRAPFELSLAPSAAVITHSATTIVLELPLSGSAALPAGFYRLAAILWPRGRPELRRSTNEVPLLIAPTITGLGKAGDGVEALPLQRALQRDQVDGVTGRGRVALELRCAPWVLPEQQVGLVLGEREAPAEPRDAAGDMLTFHFAGLAVGLHRLRLRVDGAESQLIARGGPAGPAFDDSQQVTLE